MSTQHPIGGLIAPAFARLAARDVVFEAATIGPQAIDPREAALVAGAVESRRSEFATGRWCAARALARLGAPPEPILRGTFREPLWPSGFTGSIAHHGQAAVAAACAVGNDRRRRIGIDIVDDSDLEAYRHVLHLIRCDQDDLGFMRMEDLAAAAFLFAIKEAAVKCLSPILRAFIDLPNLRVCPTSTCYRFDYPGTDAYGCARAVHVDGYIIAFAAMGAS